MERYATQFWDNKLVMYGNWILGTVDFMKSVHLIDTKANPIYTDIIELASIFSIQRNYRNASEAILAQLGEFPTKESVLNAVEKCRFVCHSLLQMYELVFDTMYDETFYITRSKFVGMDKEKAQDLYNRRHEIMRAFDMELSNAKTTYSISIRSPKNQLSANEIQ